MGPRIIIEAEQALDKFGKHAADFGVPIKENIPNFRRFFRALNAHVNDPATNSIVGTYRGTILVTHYFNAITRLDVMAHLADDRYLSGWRLGGNQESDLNATRNVS